jgi:HTH-type transcriptional regulator, cell division transcriptional repressor
MGPDYGVSHMAKPIHFAYGRCKVRKMATIGERIREKRKALKLRQGDLAELVGLDQSTISDIERGQGFGADVLMKLSDALRVDPQFVMNGVESSHTKPEHFSHSEMGVKDRGHTGNEIPSGVQDGDNGYLTIPTSMPYSAPNLHSTIRLMGSLIGALDTRSRAIIGDMLKDLALHPDEATDIAEKAAALATVQKPITENAALNKAIRGKKQAVETGHGPLPRK